MTGIAAVQHPAREIMPPEEGWADLCRVALLTNPGAAVGVIVPTVVNMFTAGGRFSLATASLLGAAELAGLTVALLLGPLFVNRYDRRWTAALAIGLAIVGQALSLSAMSAPVVGALRLFAGIGEGGLYAVAVAHLAATAAPDRAFGLMLTANHVVGALLLATIAWLSGAYPAQAAIAVVIVFQLLTATLIGKLPRRPARAAARHRPSGAGGAVAPAVLGLLGMLLLAGGFGVVWPLIGQIAKARGVSPHAVALAFSLAGAVGLLPGMLVTALGLRVGRVLPLSIGSLAFAAALSLPTFDVPFMVPTLLIMFFWTFSIPYYLGLVAAVDRSGRLTVLTTAMLPFGIAVGQALAGQIVATVGLRGVTLLGGASVIVALLAMLAAMRAIEGRSAAVVGQ